MKHTKKSKALCLITALSLLASVFWLPVSAEPEVVLSETPDISISVNASYNLVEEGSYTVLFTLLSELPAWKELSFKLQLTDATLADGEFSPAFLTEGTEDDVLRGKNYLLATATRTTEEGTPTKTPFFAISIKSDAVPSGAVISFEDFTLTDDEEITTTVGAEVTYQEGPIVPELTEDEQEAYDAICALTDPKKISFYDADGVPADLDVLSEAYTEAALLYETLDSEEKGHVKKVLEYNGYDIGILTETKKVFSVMEKNFGYAKLAYLMQQIDEKDAISYQFAVKVYEQKKSGINYGTLDNSYTVYNELKDTKNIYDTANDYLTTALGTADYTDKTYGCGDQLKIIQLCSEHIYYKTYLSVLASIVDSLYDDIYKHYSGREETKENLLLYLEKLGDQIEMLEKGLSDLPTMTVGQVLYRRSYSITFSRKKTVDRSLDASVSVIVTDSDGHEIDSVNREFPYDSYNLEVSMTATSASYPKDEYITVTAYYNLDGAEFLIDSETVLCSYVKEKGSSIGIPTGGSMVVVDTEDEEDESSAGRTFFPDGNDEEEPQEVLFRDLAGFEWAEEAINGLYYAGIVNGMEEGVFNPGGNVTREQFAKMVVQLFGVATGNTATTFKDVDQNAWYAPYIAAAVQAGYIQGQSQEYFGVGESIMRQDMATILYRALGDQGSKVVLSFSDTDAIADYAKDAVAELVGLKVINGYEDGTFRPRGTANRAEASKMIWGVYQILND